MDVRASSRAVAEYLGPPSKYSYRQSVLDPDNLLRQIELTEAAAHFGRSADHVERLSRNDYNAVLRMRTNDLPLHYKVWQILYATRRVAEAEESYRMTCDHSRCDTTKASSHACVLATSTLHPRISLRLWTLDTMDDKYDKAAAQPETIGTWPLEDLETAGHIIELPQPPIPPFLQAATQAKSGQPFLAFNPSIVKLPELWPRRPFCLSRCNRNEKTKLLVFFRYSNVRSIWATTTATAWQRAVDWLDWRWALSTERQPDLRERYAHKKVNGKATLSQANERSERPRIRDDVPDATVPLTFEQDAEDMTASVEKRGNAAQKIPTTSYELDGSPSNTDVELAAVLEHAVSKARGESSASRWSTLMAQAQASVSEATAGDGLGAPLNGSDMHANGSRDAPGNQAKGGTRGSQWMVKDKDDSQMRSNLRVASDILDNTGEIDEWRNFTRTRVQAVRARLEGVPTHDGRDDQQPSQSLQESGLCSDDFEVFDIEDDPSSAPFMIPASEVELRTAPLAFDIAPGGYSAIGYVVMERSRDTGIMIAGRVNWLTLSPPFGPCGDHDDYLWNDLTPAFCRMSAGAPHFAKLVILVFFALGMIQCVTVCKELRAHSRLAKRRLCRATLLLGAVAPLTRCNSLPLSSGGARCTSQKCGHLVNASRTNIGLDGCGVGSSPVKLTQPLHVHDSSSKLRHEKETHNRSDENCSLTPQFQSRSIQYDGYEDSRAIIHRGRIYLLASHEDCNGLRRLCLLRIKGSAEHGTLEQDTTWVLQVDDSPDGPFQLHDTEKNWMPFVEGGALHLSYSLQPHVVLRCAWSGGSCHQISRSSSDFLQTYDTFGQGLRGGTPYSRLPSGDLLAAMHVKDTAHSPALYSTAFYLISGTAPFRILSISPKVCFSERSIELSISVRCALQYVVGLAIDHDEVFVSYGQMDRQMKVAVLPLTSVLKLARTHQLGAPDAPDISDCTQ